MAIEAEKVETILRAYSASKSSENLDPFYATGTVHYHGDNGVLYGVHGKLTARDIFDAYYHCKESGAKWILAHRKDGHTIPLGKMMPSGFPFEGWWFVDLSQLPER